eukprot:CAMPEP_0197602346 /NCGR_PEP_ID=MMETSP1326-20131121/36995_1 /TAXON_ID=1155430 /ORGANISM="Genus nov. species nov., Strain RCC2288" /LENGTH=212 /DNA_ID=CAMNT_0043169683 /DNA_START=180 /DNA_END=815 /DNA_ORIENTATION=+
MTPSTVTLKLRLTMEALGSSLSYMPGPGATVRAVSKRADPLWKHERLMAMGLRALPSASYVPGPGASAAVCLGAVNRISLLMNASVRRRGSRFFRHKSATSYAPGGGTCTRAPCRGLSSPRRGSPWCSPAAPAVLERPGTPPVPATPAGAEDGRLPAAPLKRSEVLANADVSLRRSRASVTPSSAPGTALSYVPGPGAPLPGTTPGPWPNRS